MTDVETTTTDVGITNTDVKKAMTGVEKTTTDVETPTTDVETPMTDVETTTTDVETAGPAPSKWACRFRIVSRPIRDLQAHFDGKIKAVSADFRSKVEGVQTENAQLLELVRKYKSTADRCQSKLHELLSRQKSDRNSSRLTVNEYAATKASAPDTPPSHDQMQQTIGKSAESQAKKSLSASAQDPSPSEQECPPSSQKQQRNDSPREKDSPRLSAFHKKLYTPSLSETPT